MDGKEMGVGVTASDEGQKREVAVLFQSWRLSTQALCDCHTPANFYGVAHQSSHFLLSLYSDITLTLTMSFCLPQIL